MHMLNIHYLLFIDIYRQMMYLKFQFNLFISYNVILYRYL